MDDMTRAGGPVADESIATLFSHVVSDAEQVVRSEIDLQKAKLDAKVDEAKLGVVLVVVALVLGSLALIAFVVGAVLSLATLVGPLGATAIVGGILLGGSGLCGWLAVREFKRMFGAAGQKA